MIDMELFTDLLCSQLHSLEQPDGCWGAFYAEEAARLNARDDANTSAAEDLRSTLWLTGVFIGPARGNGW